MEKSNVGSEILVKASKTLENKDGTTRRYEILLKMNAQTGSVTEVLSESASSGQLKLPLYQLIHLSRQLYEHVNAPMPKRYGMTVEFLFYGVQGVPALHVRELNKITDISIDVAAKVWLPYHELKRMACYVHWLREIDSYKYDLAEKGEKEFKCLRTSLWDLEFK